MTGLMRVADFMEREVVTLNVDDHLGLADDVMRFGRMRHMPVLDGGRLVGILSQRDLFRAAASTGLRLEGEAQRRWLARLSVAEIMTRDVVTVSPSESIRHAAELMLIRKIGCVPVVDEHGALSGVLSETDCLRVLTALLAYREGVATATTPSGPDPKRKADHAPR